MRKFYNSLLIFSPWVLLAGMLQFHFQRFLPYQGAFKGEYAFDYFTVTDFFVVALVVIFLLGFVQKTIALEPRKIPTELGWAIFLLLIGGILEIFFQQVYEPALNSPFEYFRSLFVYPLIFMLIIYKTADRMTLRRLVQSYVAMVMFFCVFALLQYFTGIFPGEQKDFTGRLVWPFIDYITLKSSSANWVAFFTTPALIIAFIEAFNYRRQWPRAAHAALNPAAAATAALNSPASTAPASAAVYFYGVAFVLSATVVYLTQSYGAYLAIFATLLFFLFRAVPFKKFAAAFVAMLLLAGGVYLLQKNTYKYRILSGQQDYRYETSVESRLDIYRVNLQMILDHPLLGVGLNQYQSYFALTHEKVLGRKYNESHLPPHAHNFFMSFWTNLGFLGFVAILILLAGIFWRQKFKVNNPAVFFLLAMMVHGLIDSYYWKQEIAYIFWLMVVLSYLYRADKAS